MAKKPTLRQQIEERDALLLKALETNEAFAKQNQDIRVAANNAAAKAKELGESVALFKQEALQAAVREAELRGYIQRILEDDAERAEPAEEQQSSVVHTTVVPRNHPVRTGPPSMTGRGFEPNISYRSDCAATFRNDPPSRSDPLGQRHWLNR